MALLIKNILNYPPDNNEYYFFDSNAWIAVLKSTGRRTLDAHEQAYIDLFEGIITLYTHKGTKQEKKVRHFPKIVITSLLVSEIINAFMRNIAMKTFYKTAGKDFTKYKYKEDYRVENDHDEQLTKLISDFITFKDYIVLWDDQFNEIDPYTILPSLNSQTDFNDFYYYYMFCNKNVSIVTHDRDFRFQDIEIITSQRELLRLV